MKDYKSIVHIGLHKTGTTSIQEFLGRQRGRLLDHGYAFYEGLHIQNNHVELHAAAMREYRLSPFRHRTKQICDQAYKDAIVRRLEIFEKNNKEKKIVFSAEGLSYLRYDDEFDWLIGAITAPVLIVVCLRNRDDFLRSYKLEMKKHELPERECRNSVSYTENDTWLIDYNERLRPFKEKFGHDNVLSIDYDDVVRQEVSVIPSFLRVLGLPGCFTEEEMHIFLNASPR